MVLHLGDDVFVRSASPVVAILDSDSQPDLAGLPSPRPMGIASAASAGERSNP